MTTQTQSIRDQAHALMEVSAARLPGDVLASFAADQAAREAAGVPSGVAAPGTALPDARLFDMSGLPTSLAAVRAGRPAVVVLYRGGWCPYCNIALRTYQTQLVPTLERRGVALIAVSPEKPDYTTDSAQTNELTFPILSDPGSTFAGALGVAIHQPPAVVEAQAKLGLDVVQRNINGAGALPMPTVVVVNADGIIGWIDVHPNYATRTEVPEILAALDATT
jgi:peroxiredoxin